MSDLQLFPPSTHRPMMEFTDFVRNVLYWARSRNLLFSDCIRQCGKLTEELGEANEAYEKRNLALLEDGVGDAAVVCVILYAQLYLREYPDSDFDSLHYAVLHGLSPDYCGVGFPMVLQRLGKLNEALLKGRKGYDCMDAVQAVMIEVYAICASNSVSFNQALHSVWEEIKNRLGKTVDGVFIKD